MSVRFLDIALDIAILKISPALAGFFTFLFGGGFLPALLVAALVKVILYFFEEEIKQFALFLRKKFNLRRKLKK